MNDLSVVFVLYGHQTTKRMRKQPLLTLMTVVLVITSAYAQYGLTYLLETPLHKTEKETTRFLTTVASGRKPVVQVDGQYRSYSLEAPFCHMEYKVAADTCVMVGVRFQQRNGMYESAVKELMATTKPFGENRLKETGSRKIIYVLRPATPTITAIGYHFALRVLRIKPQ
jgi:hypothetical protein